MILEDFSIRYYSYRANIIAYTISAAAVYIRKQITKEWMLL